MTDQHPITPSPELVQHWFLGAKAMPVDQWVTDVATQAAHWGADQELDACVKWLEYEDEKEKLRAARRPKPSSLKEQALLAIDTAVADGRLSSAVSNVVRRALEQLDD